MKGNLMPMMFLELVLAAGSDPMSPTSSATGSIPVPAPSDRFDGLIRDCSARERLDPRFVKALIAVESEFYPRAVSPHGARGLMQLMPATAEEMGVDRSDLADPGSNIQAGTAYLNRLYGAAKIRYGIKAARLHDAPVWVQRRVLAAYNGGPRLLYRKSDRWPGQTRRYVRKIMNLRRSPETLFALK